MWNDPGVASLRRLSEADNSRHPDCHFVPQFRLYLRPVTAAAAEIVPSLDIEFLDPVPELAEGQPQQLGRSRLVIAGLLQRLHNGLALHALELVPECLAAARCRTRPRRVRRCDGRPQLQIGTVDDAVR